jgi:hypothetical protein
MTQDPVMAAHTDRSDLFELVRYCRFTLYCVMCTKDVYQPRSANALFKRCGRAKHPSALGLARPYDRFLLTYEGC